MGAKSSKQEKMSTTDTVSENGGSTAAMSFDMDNAPNESLKSLEVKQEIGNFEEGVSSADSELNSESRVASGIDSDVSQVEVSQDDAEGDVVVSELESESAPESEDESELVSNLTADDETSESTNNITANYEVDSLKEELENHVDLNPDPLHPVDVAAEEVGIVEEQAMNHIAEDRERATCGADVTGYHHGFQRYESNEYLPENSISSTDNSEEDITSDYQEYSSDPYPVESETRQNGIILISVKGPRSDQTQSFWKMILEKRVPTIHMTCDYVEEGVLKCAPYIPVHGESEIKCGVYMIKRLGTESQLSMNLKRQQLLIYERIGESIDYKYSVTHFLEVSTKNLDPNQAMRNSEAINKHVSHQPNPQLLVHGSW
ncbi:hypothetical protein CAEBREN_01100 [Caenorhabditis brenneri]|uniref:Tyrosine-protein phosphatase domain-containing protein n=1 Tax=Caenorhabditis brenneri TaxID=135651 RepID=G0P096_CAEBE|nr:hypothetical protein CAEBREN_01100 [Caenorhabditis brenneri]